MKRLILLLIIRLVTLTSINAQVYVKFNASGAGDGTSWQDAFVNLDTAISRTNSGQIWVAAGTYMPSVEIIASRNYKAFKITKKLALYGGFNGTETNLSQRNISGNETILSGDVGIQGVDTDNTPRIIEITGTNIDSSTIIDGFTIVKSHYTYGYDYDNGAIHIECLGDPTVRNCVIKDNFGFSAGGICVRNSDPLIINNTISNNVAFEGAGIYLDYGTNARIIGNKISNNKCIGGYSHLAGGGIKINAYCSPYIYGNILDSNYAENYGGAIANESNYSVVISNNIIAIDSSQIGGGIYINYSPTNIVNNLIFNNVADNGGGLYIDYSPNSNSFNNTIANNYAAYYGNEAYLTEANMNIINTVFHSNYSSFVEPISIIIGRPDWFPKFQYCDVKNDTGGISLNNSNYIDSIWRSGNISAYPEFEDPLNYNYQLNIQSSCINAGNPDTTGMNLPTVDLLDSNRIVYNWIDIGCYEFDSLSFHTLVKEMVVEKTINISPNPFYNKLNVQINNFESANIVLFDISSKKIIQKEFNNSTTINTENLAKGIYIYEIKKTNGEIKKGKVVKY